MRKKKLSKKERKELLLEVEKGFGLRPEDFDGLEFFKTRRKVYVCAAECLKDELFSSCETAGLLFVRVNGQLKVTTDCLQLFGGSVEGIKLNEKEMREFLAGKSVTVSGKNIKSGYVVVKYNEKPLGCGIVKGGSLRSLIAKHRRVQLKKKEK